jgi:hypothetical protein
VSAADKLHNVRCILSDLKSIGDELWKLFNAGKQDQLWYYSELVKIFQTRTPQGFITRELSPLLDALRQAVDGRG